MKKINYGALFVGFIALFSSTHILASSITPISASVMEGDTVFFSITTDANDWWALDGGSAECPVSTHQFDLSTSLTDLSATWGTELSGGDLVYFVNSTPPLTLPPPSSAIATWCATWDGQSLPAPWDLPLSAEVRTHIDDDFGEGTESAEINFDVCGDGCITTVTITIQDTPPPLVSISASRAAEPGPPDGNDGNFRFTLDKPAPGGGLVVRYAVSSSSTATASSDYEALGSSVNIPAGATSADIPVIVIDDFLREGSESVIVDILEGAIYGFGSPTTATVFIVDDDVRATRKYFRSPTWRGTIGKWRVYNLTGQAGTSWWPDR